MAWTTWRDENRAAWEARLPIHVGPEGYDVEGSLSDPTRLSQTVGNDAAALGPLGGLNVAPPRCDEGHFVFGDVFDAAALLPGRFDLVDAWIGAINWIASIGRWLSFRTAHERSHGLGEIVRGALDAGLVIRRLEEHDFTEWQMLASTAREPSARGVLRDTRERLPLLFTLQASKPP